MVCTDGRRDPITAGRSRRSAFVSTSVLKHPQPVPHATFPMIGATYSADRLLFVNVVVPTKRRYAHIIVEQMLPHSLSTDDIGRRAMRDAAMTVRMMEEQTVY
jgi:hypothetical protein